MLTLADIPRVEVTEASHHYTAVSDQASDWHGAYLAVLPGVERGRTLVFVRDTQTQTVFHALAPFKQRLLDQLAALDATEGLSEDHREVALENCQAALTGRPGSILSYESGFRIAPSLLERHVAMIAFMAFMREEERPRP